MKCDVDIAIIGGGPAGTATALALVRRAGIRPESIALFDKAVFPRDKPCAGAVSSWGIEALARMDVRVSVPQVSMRGLRVIAGDEIGAYAGVPLGIVVRRNEFDASLLREVRSDGVATYEGEPLVALERIAGGWRVITSKRVITTELLAACDGAGSTVRKLLGIKEHERKGHLYVLETALSDRDAGPRAELCDFDLSPADDGIEGYYWDFPTVIAGRPSVSRGIYHANFTARSGLKRALGRCLSRRGIDIAQVKLKPFSTRPFMPGAKLEDERLVLVGEAAGIDATTGEGIAQAILLGEIAATHLARAARMRHGNFDLYAHAIVDARVGRHLLQSAWLAKRVYGAHGASWRRFLARNESAREAGAKWYGGVKLGLGTKAKLAAKLAGAFAEERFLRSF